MQYAILIAGSTTSLSVPRRFREQFEEIVDKLVRENPAFEGYRVRGNANGTSYAESTEHVTFKYHKLNDFDDFFGDTLFFFLTSKLGFEVVNTIPVTAGHGTIVATKYILKFPSSL